MTLHDPNQVSQNLLMAVKTAAPTESYLTELAKLPLADLQSKINSDGRKKAFWINIYNAFFLILRKEKQLVKPDIYKGKHISIAGINWSLDDIEHGILRRFRYKYSLGFLPNIFASDKIKKLAVDQVDYRIHFALNCGAKSCPPIAFYTPDKIEEQLKLATLAFLETETEVLSEKQEVHISRLFLWYLGDFGGKSGIRTVLKETLDLETVGMKLVFKEYSWEEDLDNFVE